jgi:hypothetical protein
MPGDLPLRTVATPMGISGHEASGDLAAQRRPSARLAEPDTLPVKGGRMQTFLARKQIRSTGAVVN